MLKLAKTLVLIVSLSMAISAQEKALFEWDLSYNSLLEQNNVAASDWIWKWLKDSESPAKNWVATWEGKTVVSSILIEYPAFHAGERTTMWFVRTDDGAHYWELVQDGKPRRNEEEIKPTIYDSLFRTVTSWNQLIPKPANETPKDVLPGYIGFLSFYDKNGSKQILLTMEDFVICLDATCLPGKLKAGRLMAAIEPIFLSEKPHKHKSETEIARMTPAERIDEEINENRHLYDHSSNKHKSLIHKYRRMDGLKGAQHLIKLIDGYNPKRLRDTRYYDAVRIAEDIDEHVQRLRASSDGLLVIEAIRRLANRMREANDESQVEKILESFEGVNSTDKDIRETLWVKYRRKVSDSELDSFINYLIKRDPMYPGWSEVSLVKDYSRKNEAGNPLQVFIMKKPLRHYRMYRAFKQQRN